VDFVSKRGGYEGRIAVMGGVCMKQGADIKGRILFRKRGGYKGADFVMKKGRI